MRLSRLLLAALFVLLLAPATFAQEAIALTTPLTRSSIASYTPAALHIRLVPSPRITVEIIDVASQATLIFNYPCPAPCAFSTNAQVTALITTLNTVNLTTRSLWRRVFDRLVIDFPASFVGGATVQ